MTDSGNYLVGYGRPPKHTQFRKGQSGNPKGRPKNRKLSGADVTAVLGQPVAAKLRGTTRQITPFEAGVRQIAKRALAGNLGAMLEFIRMCTEFNLITRPPNPYSGVLLVPLTNAKDAANKPREKGSE